LSDLDVIAPPIRTLAVGGREVTLTPLKVRQFPAVLRAVRPILGALAERSDADAIIGTYCDNAEGINQALAAISSLTEAEINELSLEDAVSLFAAALEVNRDFFTQTLPRLLASVMGKPGSGPTP
jgi:hypothetical protein